MPDHGTAAHWRERAEEARSLAASMMGADARDAMLKVAENYEKIAKRAERLARVGVKL